MQRLESLVLIADCYSKWGEEEITYRYGKPKYYATEERLIINTHLLNADCVLVNQSNHMDHSLV